MPPLTAARYGDQALLVVSFSDGPGRDWVTQSPARGDHHHVQERGLRQRRTSCELAFCDQPGRAEYLERWLAFRTLAESTQAALFTHPTDGAFMAVVVDLVADVRAGAREVRVRCTFVAAEPPRYVQPAGAGDAPIAGVERVEVLAAQTDAELAAAGVTSATPAACLSAVQAWTDAEAPAARLVHQEAAALAADIDTSVAALELATNPDRWLVYRSFLLLRYSVIQAATAVTSPSANVRLYTLESDEPLLALCAREFGARNAQTMAGQVQQLNDLRTPGLIRAGTQLRLPVVSP